MREGHQNKRFNFELNESYRPFDGLEKHLCCIQEKQFLSDEIEYNRSIVQNALNMLEAASKAQIVALQISLK